MAEKKSFILYLDTAEQWEMLTDEQAGKLIKALLSYCQTGEKLVSNDGMLKMAFSFMAAQIDRDVDKWEQICQRRSEAGKLGGRPKKQMVSDESKKTNCFFEKAKKAKKADNDNESENENENEISGAVSPPSPSAPSPELEKLIFDFGEKAVDDYIARVKSWYADKGKPVSDLYSTVRKWLNQDEVPIIDHSIDKYNVVINKF